MLDVLAEDEKWTTASLECLECRESVVARWMLVGREAVAWVGTTAPNADSLPAT